MHETGMLAVTVMGITLARMKNIFLLSVIFVILTKIFQYYLRRLFYYINSVLPRTTIMEIFSWPIISFVLMMLFVVRPLSIWISTIGTELTKAERALVGWIAPRGIVALTVSSYFATELLQEGYKDASILTALTFALVITTVCAHGFSIGF